MTSTPEQVIAKIREALEYACNNEGTSSLISEFLLVRDQQTTQDERDEGERETSAFYIAQMVRRDSMKAVRDKVRPLLKEAEAERDALRKALTDVRGSIKNARGAVESNQVVDKDVHGTLSRAIRMIDAALQSAADTPAPQPPQPKKRVKLPPIGEELYEHYPGMSAQTHEDLVKEYALAAIAANAAEDLLSPFKAKEE